MRPFRIPIFATLVYTALTLACGPSRPAAQARHEPTTDPAYLGAVEELVDIDRGAREAFQHGDADTAAAIIQRGEPISKQLMSVPRPTLAAVRAAADLDQLYGDMLYSNRNYGWARLFYQKNRARWKFWSPQSEETVRRLKQAEAAMAECDARMAGKAR